MGTINVGIPAGPAPGQTRTEMAADGPGFQAGTLSGTIVTSFPQDPVHRLPQLPGKPLPETRVRRQVWGITGVQQAKSQFLVRLRRSSLRYEAPQLTIDRKST